MYFLSSNKSNTTKINELMIHTGSKPELLFLESITFRVKVRSSNYCILFWHSTTLLLTVFNNLTRVRINIIKLHNLSFHWKEKTLRLWLAYCRSKVYYLQTNLYLNTDSNGNSCSMFKFYVLKWWPYNVYDLKKFDPSINLAMNLNGHVRLSVTL